MNVLIACEESQTATIEFRKLGHNCFSADIQKCSGGHPEWHIKGDVLPFLNAYDYIDQYGEPRFGFSFTTSDGRLHELYGEWDLIIAHPPCTYLSRAGLCNLVSRSPYGHSLNLQRCDDVLKGREFFFKFLSCNAKSICVENPLPHRYADLPDPSQWIEPYFFGDPYSKKTGLWLINLPPLVSTNLVDPIASFTQLHSTSKQRSKSFRGIACAMASQWSDPSFQQISLF